MSSGVLSSETLLSVAEELSSAFEVSAVVADVVTDVVGSLLSGAVVLSLLFPHAVRDSIIAAKRMVVVSFFHF